jgi:hypothetical protein
LKSAPAREAAASAIADRRGPGGIDEAEPARLGQERVAGLAAAGEGEGEVVVHGAHAGGQLLARLGLVAVAGAEHVRHQHDVVLASDDARLRDGVGADALPVGLHEDGRALRLDALIMDDHALEPPAIDLVRHLLLGHVLSPRCFAGAILHATLHRTTPSHP